MSEPPTTHPCPVPGCRVTCLRFAMLLCRKHWAMLSPGMQAAVWASWNEANPTPEYEKWRAAAIAHCESLEKKP